MLWLYLALIAYFINAIVFIIDKYLLVGQIPKYHAYAFGVSILSLASLFLIPFGVSWQGLSYFLIAVSSGAAFFVGLVFFYKVIKQSDISVAATQVGTIAAVFTYIFSVIILKDALSFINLSAFLFFIFGIYLLGRIEKQVFTSAVLAGLLGGIYYVLMKYLFNESDFVNGLFWTRMGFIGSAFISLFSREVRQEVKFSLGHASGKSKFLFVFNKFLAGIGFIILYFSINLGNVSLINALLGVQFLFIFLLAIIFRKRIPEVKEKLNKNILILKTTGIASVALGFLLLFLGNNG
ncbi:MAG: hypothetical protein Q8Q89_00985 [bacterium]|nr:hypothetical protein [bacterium]